MAFLVLTSHLVPPLPPLRHPHRAVAITQRFVKNLETTFHIHGESLVAWVQDAEGTMPVECTWKLLGSSRPHNHARGSCRV